MAIDFAKGYDARGNGDGVTAPTVTGDHNNRVTDYTALALEVYRAGAFGEFVAGEAGTLKASGGDCGCGSENIVCDYRVRRLTPTECARLQGFPDWWCEDLDTPEPTEQDMAFWREVFGTYAKVNGKKPRSDNQIRKWLQHPHTDSAEYKMWGNGVSLPCVEFVLGRIAEVTQQ